MHIAFNWITKSSDYSKPGLFMIVLDKILEQKISRQQSRNAGKTHTYVGL